MSWAGQLRPASFRGVSFAVAGASKDFGRRVVTHTYPLRDRPFHEDMGRATRVFSVEAFLVGADVLSRLKALEAALETKGAGRLVHPHYGSLNAVAIASSTVLAAGEGRVARIRIAFEEAATSALPVSILDTVSRLLSAVDSASAEVLRAVVTGISLVSQAAGVADAMVSGIRSLSSGLAADLSAAGLPSRTGALGAIVSPVSGRAMTIPAALASLTSLGADDLGDGSAVLTLIARTIRTVALVSPGSPKAFTSDPDESVKPVDALLASAVRISMEAVPAAGVARANARLLGLLGQSVAAASAADAAQLLTWDSRDQLIAYGAAIGDALGSACDVAGDLGQDAAWRQLSSLSSAWGAHVTGISPPLPRVAKVTPRATLPVSLLAYQLDGDALSTVMARGGSIARRNRARHPGFMPGGAPLEVVGNG